MNLNERKKLFIRFLKENNCYINFFSNLYKQKNDWQDCNSSINELVLAMIAIHKDGSEIDYGFNWGCTEETFSYWSKLNIKWKNILELTKKNDL